MYSLPPRSSLGFGIKMVGLQLLFTQPRCSTSTFSERHSHECQESLSFLISFSCRCDTNVHSPRSAKRVELYFWEHALFADPDGVISMSIKAV